jgi:hypothetical protein
MILSSAVPLCRAVSGLIPNDLPVDAGTGCAPPIRNSAIKLSRIRRAKSSTCPKLSGFPRLGLSIELFAVP